MKTRSMALIQGLALACAVSVMTTGCGKAPAAAPRVPDNNLSPPAITAKPASTTVGTEIDDSVVTTRVKSALLADHDVKSFDIKVETRKGVVQLSGFIDTQARIDNAVALVRRVEGVGDVENAMTVKEGRATVGNVIDDGIVTTKVKSALLGDGSINGSDIHVVTRKGEVQLSGYVGQQHQIDRAVIVTRSVDGVQSIDNQMSLKK